MKTIGFVDYYISEWHANNYPIWIAELCKQTGEEFCVKYAWAEEYVSPVDGRNTDEWCAAFGVEKCDSLEELCEKADYILVLSPSNPEKHLGYAQTVLKYGKNTYIDKTFAPDLQTAQAIFDLASKYNTKFFSSSALRYATELDFVAGCNSLLTTGGGGSLDEYIIHQVEMVVKTMQSKAVRLRVEQQGSSYDCRIRFEDGKQATMRFAPSLPFSVCAAEEDGKNTNKAVVSDFFKALLADILRFFTEGKVSFDVNQTLEVMKIREGVINGKNALGQWRDL